MHVSIYRERLIQTGQWQEFVLPFHFWLIPVLASFSPTDSLEKRCRAQRQLRSKLQESGWEDKIRASAEGETCSSQRHRPRRRDSLSEELCAHHIANVFFFSFATATKEQAGKQSQPSLRALVGSLTPEAVCKWKEQWLSTACIWGHGTC